MDYKPRIIDIILASLCQELPAVSLVGAKGVGKTETAKRLCKTVLELDIDASARALVTSKRGMQALKDRPILIDEWTREATSWDVVRRVIDEDVSPNHFILTGSNSGKDLNIHSGAGRIVQLKMWPLSFEERDRAKPVISLDQLLMSNDYAGVYEESNFSLQDYAHEIFVSGFPGIRTYSRRAIKELLRGYIDNIINKEFVELNIRVRKPTVLRAWLTAYAAATGTTTSYAKILRAATPGEDRPPSSDTTLVYRDILDKLFLTDRVDPWLPTSNTIATLGRSQKHYLVDAALALSLLGYTEEQMLGGGKTLSVGTSRDNSLFGRLFESMVASSLKVYAQSVDATLSHFRTSDGRHEVDFIIERDDVIVGMEVNLSTQISGEDAKHLNWLEAQLRKDKTFIKVVVYTGTRAYRREDGILVVPFSLLGS